jgi:D-inositol-3-phosphate glycosyltransferase
MRIIILGTAHPFRGGLASYNERLAGQLLSQGHDVEILTFTLQYPGFLFPGKSQLTDSSAPEGLRITRILNSMNPFNWLRTGRVIRKKNPDILLIKYWIPAMAPCLGSVARIVGKGKSGKTRVICIFDNVIPHEKSFIDRILTRYFTGSIHGAIVMSGSVGEDLKSFRVNIPVRFNPHPLYDNYGASMPRNVALGRMNLDPGFSYLLFFGFIRAYKGLDLLLGALSDNRLRSMKIKLIVAGEFYESDLPYRELITNNNLSGEVLMLDRFIGEDEVAPLFCSANLVVQPYRSATQSGVTQIAYHFEKPMLVTDVGGLSEIVPDHRCGYVVTPDSSSIADAIVDYFTNNREAEYSKNVMEEKSRYTWDKLTTAIIDVYEKTFNDILNYKP